MTLGSVISHNLFTQKPGISPWAVPGIRPLVFSHSNAPFQHHGQRPVALCIGSQYVVMAALTMAFILTHVGFCMCVCVWATCDDSHNIMHL